MRTKHTPGPWKACKDHEDFNGPYFDIEPEDLDYYQNKPYVRICSKDGNVTTNHDLFEFQEANAKLIAAAPELFEALELCIKTWRNPNYSNEDFHLCFDKAEQAIKKAKGE
jgi:hypothetical protein